jgi:outer membrane receptor protein involved in Fe transport
LDDALRQVPGLTLFRRTSSRTANPTTQGINLRGIGGSGTSRAAVLFDGISLNDAFGGWTYWSRVPQIAVEQIEVLRGGASALYGTGALKRRY